MGKRGFGRMVGRDEELRDCLQVLEEVEKGLPSTILILGEAGLGKSRLSSAVVDEVRERGGLVLTGHGLDLDGGELPYGLVTELLRDLSRQLGATTLQDLLDDGLSALAPLTPRGSATRVQIDRVLVVAAMLTLLERLGEGRTVCWWIEDLQWADQASRDVVRYVSRTADASRLLLLATVRTEPDGATQRELAELLRGPGIKTLHLRRLDPDEVRSLVAELNRDSDLAPAQVDRISEVSDGIPFFVEELARTSTDQLPGSLHGLLVQRLDELSAEGRNLAAAVATGADEARFATLLAVMAEDDIDRALAECVEAGVLIADGPAAVVRFRHVLLAEAALKALLPQELRDWHRRWATWLDGVVTSGQGSSEAVFQRARHWNEAGEPAMALRTAIEAALTAKAAEAYAESSHHWGNAHALWLQAAPAVEDLPTSHHDVVAEWITASYFAGELEPTAQHLDAVRRSPDFADDWLVEAFIRETGDLIRTILDLPALSGLSDEEREALVTRLAMLPPSPMVVGTADNLAANSINGDRPLSDQAFMAITSIMAKGDTRARIGSHNLLGRFARYRRGDALAALDHHRDAFDEARMAGLTLRVRPVRELLWTLWELGRGDEGLELAESMLAQLPIRASNVTPSLAFLVVDYAWVLAESGRLADALEYASVVHDHTDAVVLDLDARQTLVRVLGRQGRFAEAEDLLPAQGQGKLADFAALSTFLELAAQRGDRDSCRALARQMLGHPRAGSMPNLAAYGALPVARLLLDGSGTVIDPEDVKLLTEFTSALTDPTPKVFAIKTEIDALVADLHGHTTASTWEQIADTWSEFGQPFDEAMARLRLASALAAGGESTRATDQLQAVQRIAEALPSPWLADRALEAARVHGLRIRTAQPVAQGAGPLTAREHEVLTLIAEGLSNQEIADRLFMSPKTASVHVSRIITKLGVRNRTEATALAHRSGLVTDKTPDESSAG